MVSDFFDSPHSQTLRRVMATRASESASLDRKPFTGPSDCQLAAI